jgi:hypothetical protein
MSGVSSVTSTGSRLPANLDPSSVTDKGQRWRCNHCSKAVTSFAVFRTGSYSKRLCSTCAEWENKCNDGEWWRLMGPCAVCGHNVYASPSCWRPTHPCPNGWLLDRYGGEIICSLPCTKQFRLKLRRDERAAARGGKACEVCGNTIKVSRADATTCSNKCRQTAYRRRKA